MSPSPAAGLLFVGGNIGGPGHRRPPGTAVAVSGDRILAVGAEDRLAELRTPRTDVIDLRGRTLLPGFQDAHVHPVFAALDLLRCDLRDSPSAAGYLDTVARYAREHPDHAWIVGGGWTMDAFPGGTPTAAMLDAVASDRPVYLTNRDCHGAWVNTRALQLAGIGPATADPADGRIERDPTGHPTGLLHEGATVLVSRHLPQTTDTERAQALHLAQKHLHALGITAWQDAIIGDYLGMRTPLPAYLDAADHDTLTARVTGALWWDRHRGIEQVGELTAIRDAASRDRFQPRMVKIMLDGIVETRTASMLDSYCGGHDPAPASFFSPGELAVYVIALDQAGFSVHFHAVGDRAIREALDAVQAARTANGPRGHRHQIAHLDVVHPDDIPRFRQLDVIANIQALWACHEPQMDDYKIPLLGPTHTTWSFPFHALRAHGARLAAGSDWGVSSADPLAAIHVAVNRIHPDLPGEPFLPEQRLALTDALTAYTSGSAYANHLDQTGAIHPGYLADLIVLDHDLDSIPARELSTLRVDRTYIGGHAVYTAPASTLN